MLESEDIFPVLTALSLPAISTFPSASNIQWSGEGQAVILTRQAVLIMTPDLGITISPSSALKLSSDKAYPSNYSNSKSLGWYRTMIEWTPENFHPWALDCQDWAAVALGSIDPSLISVACSPCLMSHDAACIYAILDSNMEVSLYKPVKHYITGKWQKMGDFRDVLLRVLEDIPGTSRLAQTLNQQITCIGWSAHAAFGINPAPCLDASLLAAGSCAGSVILSRCSVENGLDYVTKIDVGNSRITHLAWSPWTSIQEGHSEALIACALANGSVVVGKIKQNVILKAGSSNFLPEYDIAVSYEPFDEVSQATRRQTSSLRWIGGSAVAPILVFGRTGTINLWRPQTGNVAWHDQRTITLETQQISADSCALTPITGIAHIPAREALVVSLADGSFHVVTHLSTDPRLSSDQSSHQLFSKSLSLAARSHFVTVEEDEMQNPDVNSIHGMASVDNDAFFLWIHEATRPTGFDYKQDARHTNMMVLAQLCNSMSDEEILKDLRDTMLRCKAVAGESPSSSLRSIYIHLRDPQKLADLSSQILDFASSFSSSDLSQQIIIEPWNGSLTAEFRRQFRDSLRTHLFYQDYIHRQRLLFSLHNTCQRTCDDRTIQEQFRAAATNIVKVLWPQILRIILRHFVAVQASLLAPDVTFVRRFVLQTGLPSIPQDVRTEAEALSSSIAILGITSNGTNIPDVEDLCPACHAPLPMTDITTTSCANGHTWQRCSITSLVLSTPMVRTCTGCSLKALLPSGKNETDPQSSTRSWLLDDLLDAVRRCLVCGGSFVTLI